MRRFAGICALVATLAGCGKEKELSHTEILAGLKARYGTNFAIARVDPLDGYWTHRIISYSASDGFRIVREEKTPYFTKHVSFEDRNSDGVIDHRRIEEWQTQESLKSSEPRIKKTVDVGSVVDGNKTPRIFRQIQADYEAEAQRFFYARNFEVHSPH